MAIKIYSKATAGGQKLSANFSVIEFACKDGSDKILVDEKLVLILQKIRNHFGKPVTISSAYRTVTYNRKIGGASNSMHTKGRAADIYISGIEPAVIAAYAEKLGVLGIGLYTKDRFVHVDTREEKYFWRNAGSEVKVDTHGGTPTYAKTIMDKASLGADTIKFFMGHEYPYDLIEKLAAALE